jgi:integrase
MEARNVRMLRDEKAETPEAANQLVKMLRQVFAYAVVADLAKGNPAKEVPYLKSGKEGFHTWTIDEVCRFEERHPIGTKARLALALMLYTGQRRSDIIQFGRQHVKNGWLKITQQKNRNRAPITVEIPVLPVNRHAIRALTQCWCIRDQLALSIRA